MTKFLKNCFIDTPIAMLKDMVTIFGLLTNKNEPYTVTLLKKIQDEQQ